MGKRVIAYLILEGLFALFLLLKAGLLRRRSTAAAAVVLTVLAFGIRCAAFPYLPLDYRLYLSHWAAFYRYNNIFFHFAIPPGCNYNVPYLYFLGLISYSQSRDLYLIKLFSVFFDIVLAWSVMRIVGRFLQSEKLRLGCFFTVLLLPTVCINSAVWAQCDSIYVGLAVLGIWLALDDRPVLSMICAAAALGFKLQAVFFLPVYLVLWMQGKLKLRHFLVFPLTYLALILPAVLLGAPLGDTLLLYFNQAESDSDYLAVNAPSLYSILYALPFVSRHEYLISRLAILAGAGFTAALLGCCFAFRRSLNDRLSCKAGMLFALGIPYFLPYMHDRYFYGADITSLLLAFTDKRYIPIACLIQCASLMCYSSYFGKGIPIPSYFRSVPTGLALIVSLVLFLQDLRGKTGGQAPRQREALSSAP